ncbi:MAG: M23 family metallopeptidase [Deltaproteobacteria bacterium]|nr:M23 family metallopeptidase [Deltaproteobacteria bacterium]
MIPEFLKNPPLGRPWLLYGLLGTSVVLNTMLVLRLDDEPATMADATPTPEATGAAAVLPVGEATEVSNAALPPELVPPLPEPKGVAAKAGTTVFSGAVSSSLSATFQGADARSPAALSAVYARLFVWDVDLRRDLHKGDRVDVLFEDKEGAEPLVLAARLHLQPGTASERLVDAYRYQAAGDRFPSYWSSDGVELPRRLIDGPLGDYEQISSLLRDRPTHEGMDFKTPIGTDIVAPRAGKVTRVNWNHAANGNCVELRFSDGTLAKFLHLNENAVKEGQSVVAGELLGKTGNTGRSTGPHLHYQLEKGSRVVDPVDYHGTLRRNLPADGMADFHATVKDLAAQLDVRVASL